MAEQWTVAFGRYLRTLRERQGLSLREVASLSQAFADPMDKGYLSRCENGLQRLAFSKAIPLCRIYKIPADALLERMELDMELEQVGAPATDSMNLEDLTSAGRQATAKGDNWRAYAFMRDAATVAATGPLSSGFDTIDDQLANAQTNCAACARTLGKLKYARHEFQPISESDDATPDTMAMAAADGGPAPPELPPVDE